MDRNKVAVIGSGDASNFLVKLTPGSTVATRAFSHRNTIALKICNMLPMRAKNSLCNRCKLDLYVLFSAGFAASRTITRAFVCPPKLFRAQSRTFRTTATQCNNDLNSQLPKEFDRSPNASSDRDVELNARKAREIFGHTLPANLLSVEEYQVYERLYGAPLRVSNSDDIAQIQKDLTGEAIDSAAEEGDLTIFRTNRDGAIEAVEDGNNEEAAEEFGKDLEPNEDYEADDTIMEEDAASLKARQALRQDMIDAERRHYIEMGTDEDNEYMDENGPRSHAYTAAGRYGTDPFSIIFPNRTFINPITEMLKVASRKQLVEMSQRTFGGPRLQDSIATPVKPKAEHFQQKPIALEALQPNMGEMEANAYVAVNLPGAYASAMSILVECRKRLGSTWLEGLISQPGGPRILDVGTAGAGVLAWRDILRAEWARLHPDVQPGDPVPFGKATVVVGSSELRSRVGLLLDNTTFIPRMPEFIPTRDIPGALKHDPSLRKQYDVIIAAHSLWTLKEDYMRKAQIQNYFTLLNPNGGVLIVLEKGVPHGFELVAGAREVLLKHHISSPGDAEGTMELTGYRTHKEPGMIIAPCTNHGQCPMYPEAGKMVHRKDWCYFSQRFVRPPFLQDILGRQQRNHEDIQFSYVAVRRGIDSRPQAQAPKDEAVTIAAKKGYEKSETEPNMLSLPRVLLPPLKRHKHIVLDVCTPAGQIERWTTSRSFSRQSYRDGRKARWGDLWALGAKVRVIREARTGYSKPKDKRKSSKIANDMMDGEIFSNIDHNVSPDTARHRAPARDPVKSKRPRRVVSEDDE